MNDELTHLEQRLADTQLRHAGLLAEVATLEEDYNTLLALRQIALEDVPVSDLRAHVRAVADSEQTLALTRAALKLARRAASAAGQDANLAARALGRRRAAMALAARRDDLRAALAPGLAAIEDAARDPDLAGHGLVRELVGLRQSLVAALDKL